MKSNYSITTPGSTAAGSTATAANSTATATPDSSAANTLSVDTTPLTSVGTVTAEKKNEGQIVGYVRVSPREQNEARQVVALREFGVQEIFLDKQSGKDGVFAFFSFDVPESLIHQLPGTRFLATHQLPPILTVTAL